MSNQESAEIKMQVNSIGAVYKQPKVSFMTTGPQRPIVPEIDPDHIQLSVLPLVDELRACGGGSILIRKDDVKRLNLMVGDIVTVKITKS